MVFIAKHAVAFQTAHKWAPYVIVSRHVASLEIEATKKRPGKNWPERFVKRHGADLKSCYLTGLDLSRSKADSIKQITLYFEQVWGANFNRSLY